METDSAAKRSIRASVTTFVVGISIAVLVALLTAFAGGGILAFIAIVLIGGVVSFVFAAIVMMFTTPAKR